jgi:hypothetical protein
MSSLVLSLGAPKRLIRAKQVAEVYYAFGDASQDGFGFNMQKQKGDTIHYCFRQWCNGVSKKTSSNYQELYNLVSRLEELVEDGTLEGCKVFIFTDNTTTEAAFYKGNSSSKYLYKLHSLAAEEARNEGQVEAARHPLCWHLNAGGRGCWGFPR